MEQIDVSDNNITEYALYLDEDILSVAIGSNCLVLPKHSSVWSEDLFYIENNDETGASDVVSSVAVSASTRHILFASKEEILQYRIGNCTANMPTQSPSSTTHPSISSLRLSPSPSPSSSPVKETAASGIPTASPTQPAKPALSCYPIEIKIIFDKNPFGTGFVLTNVDTMESFLFFPTDNTLANEHYTDALCVDGGSYKFVFYDSYGDGLQGSGRYIVTSNSITLAKGSAFAWSEETTFELLH